MATAYPATVAATQTVTTPLGTGVPGYSTRQGNNPYGIIFGPDGAGYFCDLDNQRISPPRSKHEGGHHVRYVDD